MGRGVRKGEGREILKEKDIRDCVLGCASLSQFRGEILCAISDAEKLYVRVRSHKAV